MISPAGATRPPTSLRLIPRLKINTASYSPRPHFQNPYEGLSEDSSALLKLKLDHFQGYRRLPRVVEKNVYKQRPNKPEIDYLLTMEREKHSPRSLGVLKISVKGGDVVAPYYFIGKDCAHALAHSLDGLTEVEKVNLQGNKLSSSSSVKILKRLHSKQTRELNMSGNTVGLEGIAELYDILQSEKCVIKKLHLENCSLSTKHIETLCQALAGNSSVKELNLARNHLGEACGVHIGDMLRRNSTIVRLDLHWNSIRSPGALKLIDGLGHNDDLEEIDLSWNSLGQGDDDRVPHAIKDWVKADTHVRHVDLSFNYISAKQCGIINEGLKSNHTLIGLHIVGNYCEIDSRGFLLPTVGCERTSDALISPRIVKQTHGVGDKCWICEKWVEVTITLEDASLEPPVFIHFDFDKFEPEMMREEGYKTTITRVVPPGKPRFFLSTLMGVVTSTEFESDITSFTKLVTYYDGCTAERQLTMLHWISAYEPSYSVKNVLPTLPRTPRAVYKPPVVIKEKEPWRLPVSLMATYRFTTEELNSDCFEQDWKCSKITKLIKDPAALEACREKLKQVYSSM